MPSSSTVPPSSKWSWQSIWEFQFQVKHIVYLIAAILAVRILWGIAVSIYKWIRGIIWKKKALKFREQRDQKLNAFVIPNTLLDQATVEQVLNGDVTALKLLLGKNKVTSEDLVNIFAKRIQQYGVEYGIITHLKYEEAIIEARECDKKRKNGHPDAKGLLFGVPISIKETFDEKGFPSTVGCIKRIDNIQNSDGINVQLLRKAGAIPFLRTNVPQAAMTFESMNDVYGRVCNPWNKTKYAGGSSGGEGAAVAGRLSPLGIGSDIGGSIRIPAAMCGVYGFKPTSFRSILAGHTFYSASFAGQISVPCCAGPIGKSVDDCILMFKSLSDPAVLSEYGRNEVDSFFTRLPIDEKALTNTKSKRKFGYFKTLDVLDATSCYQRAVGIAVEKLQQAGHECVLVDLPAQEQIVGAFMKVLFADGLQSVYDLLQGEELNDEYKLLELSAEMPKTLKSILGWLFGACGQPRLKFSLECSNKLSVAEYKEVTYQITVLQKTVLRLFDELKIEALICPAFGAPALNHGSSADISDLAAYTFIWNVLNFPAGVIPVTKVQADEQNYDNSRVKDAISKSIDKQMKLNTEGLPVGIQIVTPPFQEETCLNVMKLIDKQINFYEQYSFPELTLEKGSQK